MAPRMSHPGHMDYERLPVEFPFQACPAVKQASCRDLDPCNFSYLRARPDAGSAGSKMQMQLDYCSPASAYRASASRTELTAAAGEPTSASSHSGLSLAQTVIGWEISDPAKACLAKVNA